MIINNSKSHVHTRKDMPDKDSNIGPDGENREVTPDGLWNFSKGDGLDVCGNGGGGRGSGSDYLGCGDSGEGTGGAFLG